MLVDFCHKTSLRVRYGETDQMGYCYYGNYAQYFEVGRVEALRDVGMSYKSLEDQGVMLPVSDFQVSYKFPAKYDDLLCIQTCITAINGSRLLFEYIITNEENITIAKASTTLVFVSKSDMKPIRPPKIFLDAMKKYCS